MSEPEEAKENLIEEGNSGNEVPSSQNEVKEEPEQPIEEVKEKVKEDNNLSVPPLSGSQDPMSQNIIDSPEQMQLQTGLIGLPTMHGVNCGGTQKVEEEKLKFNPKVDLSGYKRIYLSIGEPDFYDYVSKLGMCCYNNPMKIYIPSKEPNGNPVHLFSISNHIKCDCSKWNCVPDFFGNTYACCNAIINQLDFRVKGIPFATMGKYIKPGCYCDIINGWCVNPVNNNLIRLNFRPDDADAEKGEYLGLINTPVKWLICVDNTTTNFHYGKNKKYSLHIPCDCCTCFAVCNTGIINISIKNSNDKIIGSIILRKGVYGTGYDEDGKTDPKAHAPNPDYDINRNDQCAAPVSTHFVFNFYEEIPSVDKFDIICMLVYRLNYDLGLMSQSIFC